MTDTVVKEAFLALVRRGLRTGEDGSFPALDARQWEGVLELGTAQGVTGLLFSGVESLPPEVVVPEQIIFRLMVEADRIMRRAEQVSKAAASLIKALEEKGLHPTVMKGPAVAAFYPDPRLRESGDLDIFLRPGEFEAAVDALSLIDYHKDPDGGVFGGDDEQDAVKAIHHTAVPGQQFAEIFDTVVPFYDGRRQIPEHGDDRQNDRHGNVRYKREIVVSEPEFIEQKPENDIQDYREQHAADGAFDGLFWAYAGGEFMFAEFPSENIRADIAAPGGDIAEYNKEYAARL